VPQPFYWHGVRLRDDGFVKNTFSIAYPNEVS
jgi:hypothetical protein